MKSRFTSFTSWIILSVATVALLLSSPAQAYANLVLNPSVETTGASGQLTGWYTSGWGNNTATYSYKSTGQASGHSLRVDIKNYVDGDAKWYAAPVGVTPSTPYIYSDYYKSSAASTIVAQFGMADGSTQYMWLSDQLASTSWKQAKGMLITPPNTKSLSILHLLSSNGYLQIDNVIIKQPEPIAMVDNVANSSAEQADELAPSLPAAWQKSKWGNNSAAFSYVTAGHTGTRSLKVTVSNYIDGDAKWVGEPITVEPGVSYIYRDYYKASAITDVTAEYTDAAGNTSYQWLGSGVAKTSWQHAGFTVTPPVGTKTLRVLHTIAANGYLQVDDITLPKKLTAQVVNGVTNGDIEQADQLDPGKPLSWSTAGWGSNTTKYSYIATGHNGTHSVRIDTTKYTSGDAKWLSAPAAVTPGADYIASDDYHASIDTHVVAQLNMQDGSTQYLQLKNAPAASSWAEYRDVFSVPQGVSSVQIMHLISAVGWLETDDYSLLLNPADAGFASPIVSLTFDDGWASIYQNALPLLQKYNASSTQFIATGLLNTPDYMTSSQVQAMHALGHEVGSHTVSHLDLTTLSPLDLEHELADSQSMLNALIGAPVTSFATPYGSYNSQVLTAIANHYYAHRSTDVGYNTRTSFDRYNIRTQDILSTTTSTDVSSWLQKAIQDKSWLVLTYHQIDTSGSAYSSTPAELDKELQIIQSAGVPVRTVSQALSILTPQL